MDLSVIILLVLLMAFIALFVSRPFFVRERIPSIANNPQLSALLAERERTLIALQELDADQALGKIPLEDYSTQRADLLKRGGEILRQIDALVSVPEKSNSGKISGSEAPVQASIPLTEEVLEELIAMRRNKLKDKTSGFCPQCGKPVLFSDVFCSSCGYALKDTQ
jgi:hypothetical protein